MAGRNKEKLEQARADLAAIDKDVENIELLVADLSSDTSLKELAASTKVLITTVGPYARLGYPVVKVRLPGIGRHFQEVT
jgi:short subunit dehydrogenase-like uncharacterized protein